MSATATVLEYPELVNVDAASAAAFNIVDTADYGHRVQVSIPVADLNNMFEWNRASGTAAPVGSLTTAGSTLFGASLTSALNTNYADIDAVTGMLDFSSSVFGAGRNPDARAREAGVSANDLVLSYVLNKVYGSSAVLTADIISNMEDSYGMLTSEDMANEIQSSFAGASAAGETGGINTMFKDLLSSDLVRFTDANGLFPPGLKEKNVSASTSGSWRIAAGDILQVKVKFAFKNKVTTRNGSDGEVTDVLTDKDTFNIRLQILATA